MDVVSRIAIAAGYPHLSAPLWGSYLDFVGVSVWWQLDEKLKDRIVVRLGRVSVHTDILIREQING